ncbi:MAG TPA: sugar transferase [Bacteroidia bacterium]|nr:sugar transferase [Bacteroidia bacterium]
MSQKLAPIVIFVYRRDISDIIKKLLKNKLSSESKLYIFSDGYKSSLDKKDVTNVRKVLQNIKGFQSVKVYESKLNKGLANSIIDGVNLILDKYNKIIVMEDDLLVADNFLDYMNEALEFYEKQSNIWSISGYSPNLNCLKTYNKDIYLTMRASSWGWATWKDRWSSIDWEIKEWDNFRKNKTEINEFNKSGNDMFKMLELQMLGKIDSWAIRWCYNQFTQRKYTIYPTKSKLVNIGFDNKGTHNSRGFERWDVDVSNTDVVFDSIEPDKQIIECFKKYYNLKIITRFGYFLKKTGGYKIAKKLLNNLSK